MWMFFLLALIIGAIAQHMLAPQVSMSIMFVSFILIGIVAPFLWAGRQSEKRHKSKG